MNILSVTFIVLGAKYKLARKKLPPGAHVSLSFCDAAQKVFCRFQTMTAQDD
jgi:hypothetical protein